MRTKSSELVADNLDEVLVKIIKFTQYRHRVLTENIDNAGLSDFTPKDLAVQEFADLIDYAILEHIRSDRLLLCDGETVKFGPKGTFEAKPTIDKDAEQLCKENRRRYLKVQKRKLMENYLNNNLAVRLLKEKRQTASAISR